MSTSKILKIKDADGNLQRVSSTDETYLAWQAGKQMAASTGNSVGDLTMTGTPNRTVGSHVDTFYNEPVGTHPASQLTIGSTTSTLKQRTGTPSLVGDQFQPNGRDKYQKPITYTTLNDKLGIHPILTDEFDDLIDRLNSIIATNDYLGSYKLAATAPSSDYTERFTLGTDTRSDGTSTDYKIWQRTTQTAPTAEVQPAYLLDSDGYQGIYGMSNTEARWTLGQASKGRRQIFENIGTYQLRSSVEGAPTATGSWKNVGTALDTRNTTAEQTYTRSRVSTFSRTRSENYENTFESEGFQIYTGDFTGDYGNYSRPFTGDFVGYSSPFTGDFLTDYTADYELKRDSTFSTDYVSSVNIEYIPNYVGDYVGTYTLYFQGNFTGEYEEPYSRSVDEIFTNFSELHYEGNFSNFASPYTRDFAGNFQNYASPFEGNYSNFASPYVGTFENVYEGQFEEPFVLEFIGNFTQAYEDQNVEHYTNNTTFEGNFNKGYESDNVFNTVFEQTFAPFVATFEDQNVEYYEQTFAPFASAFEGNFTGTFDLGVDGYSKASYQAGTDGEDYTSHSTRTVSEYYSNFVNPSTINYEAGFIGDFVSEYERRHIGDQGFVNEDIRLGYNAFLTHYQNDSFVAGQEPNLQFYNNPPAYSEAFESYNVYTSEEATNFSEQFMTQHYQNHYTSSQAITFFGANASYKWIHNQDPGGGAGNYLVIWGGQNVASGAGNPSYAVAGPYVYWRGAGDGGNTYQPHFKVGRNQGDESFQVDYTTGPGSATGEYMGNFQNHFEGNFVHGGFFIGNFESLHNYLRYYTAQEYIANYQHETEATFSKDYVGDYAPTYTGNYEGNFGRQYSGNYTGDFQSFTLNQYERDFTRTSTGNYNPTYTGNYAGNFATHYTPNYETHYIPNYTATYLEAFAVTYTGNYAGNFSTDYTGFQQPYSRTFTGNFTGPFAADYEKQFTRAFTRQRTEPFSRTSVVHRTSTFSSPFTTNYQGNYTGTFEGNFTGTVSQEYSRTSTRSFEENFGGNFATFTEPFVTNYEGNYENVYSSTYISNYETPYETNYEEEFAGNYTRGRVSTFTRLITIDRNSTFEGNYIGDFITDYSAAYENYEFPFEGEYVGTTLTSNQATVETFTLYVRQS